MEKVEAEYVHGNSRNEGGINVAFYTDHPLVTPRDLWISRELWLNMGGPRRIKVTIEPMEG